MPANFRAVHASGQDWFVRAYVGTGEEVRIVEERHYQLVPADSITAADLKSYAHR